MAQQEEEEEDDKELEEVSGNAEVQEVLAVAKEDKIEELRARNALLEVKLKTAEGLNEKLLQKLTDMKTEKEQLYE